MSGGHEIAQNPIIEHKNRGPIGCKIGIKTPGGFTRCNF